MPSIKQAWCLARGGRVTPAWAYGSHGFLMFSPLASALYPLWSVTPLVQCSPCSPVWSLPFSIHRFLCSAPNVHDGLQAAPPILSATAPG